MLRLNRGISQAMLAQRIGVTFQQVQKYEQGANRVGASRLAQIAYVLRVSVGEFFESSWAEPRGLDSRDRLLAEQPTPGAVPGPLRARPVRRSSLASRSWLKALPTEFPGPRSRLPV